MSDQGAANISTTLSPIYTGNNIDFMMNGATIGVIQTVTVSRSIGRRPVYQVGSPLFADAPVTAVAVTISISSMVIIPSATIDSLVAKGILPSGSLVSALTSSTFPCSLVDANGNVVCSAPTCFYNGDTFNITNNEPLTLSLNLIAQDAMINV